jgi:hypothetical protein
MMQIRNVTINKNQNNWESGDSLPRPIEEYSFEWREVGGGGLNAILRRGRAEE